MFVCCRYFACFYIFVSIVVNTCDAQNDTETTTASEFKYAKYFKNISSINNATIPDAARDVISQVINFTLGRRYPTFELCSNDCINLRGCSTEIIFTGDYEKMFASLFVHLS